MSLNQHDGNFVRPMIPAAIVIAILAALITYFSVTHMVKSRIEKQYLATFSGTVKWTGMKRDAQGKKRWNFSVEDSAGSVFIFSECVDAYLATRLKPGDQIIKASIGSSATFNNEVVNLFDCPK